jgi:hypothetical protein
MRSNFSLKEGENMAAGNSDQVEQQKSESGGREES